MSVDRCIDRHPHTAINRCITKVLGVSESRTYIPIQLLTGASQSEYQVFCVWNRHPHTTVDRCITEYEAFLEQTST